jgi:hypothetical protein
MTALKLNGLPLRIAYETWREEADEDGDLEGDSLGPGLAEARSTRKRRFSCMLLEQGLEWDDRSGVANDEELEKLIRYIEGDGQSWRFDSTLHSLSGNGVTNTASPGATLTKNAGGGKYGGHLDIGAGGVFGVDMRNKLRSRGGWDPTKGWTLMCWRNFVAGESAAAGYHHVILKGAVAFTRGASSGNPAGVTQYIDGVAGSHALGRCFSVAVTDPYVGPWGYKTDNTTAAIDYDELVFLPYEIPTKWIGTVGTEGMIEFHDNYPWPRLPRVVIAGDLLPSDPDGVQVTARVKQATMTQLLDNGTVKKLRTLQLQMREWVE